MQETSHEKTNQAYNAIERDHGWSSKYLCSNRSGSSYSLSGIQRPLDVSSLPQSMQKIISLFKRRYDGDRLVYDELVPGSEWVAEGEGVATRKYDGTSCMVSDRRLYKRFDCKRGKTPPSGFIPSQDPDPITGHWPGWLLVGDGPEDRWHREAFTGNETDGTYELCGPKVQGNPEGFEKHTLIPHGKHVLPDAPRSFESLKTYLRSLNIEGIVWHHKDGRMVKIKRKDFGLSRTGT